MISSLQYKGLDYFDYILKEQQDELINNDKLAEDFLDIFEKTGLLFEKENAELSPEITEPYEKESE